MNIILILLKNKNLFVINNYSIIVFLSKAFPDLFNNIKINNLNKNSNYYVIQIPKITIKELNNKELESLIKYIEKKNIKPVIVKIENKEDLINLFIKYFNSLATKKIEYKNLKKD